MYLELNFCCILILTKMKLTFIFFRKIYCVAIVVFFSILFYKEKLNKELAEVAVNLRCEYIESDKGLLGLARIIDTNPCVSGKKASIYVYMYICIYINYSTISEFQTVLEFLRGEFRLSNFHLKLFTIFSTMI